MPAGRPKEPFVPWDGWKEEIIALYSEGASDVEIRGLVAEKMENKDTCSWDLWDRWLKDESEFSETVKKGRTCCEIWWQKKGRTCLHDGTFSSTLWYMNMKNRFGWRDKQELTGKDGNPIETKSTVEAGPGVSGVFYKLLHELPLEDKTHAMREAIKTDLYFLVKYVLDYWWLCWHPHKEFCEEIQKDRTNSLFLLPRGHCKTQIFNTGHTLQSYLNNPTEPIGIFCDIQKRASWKLRPLKYQFEANKTLHECFPDIIYQNPKKESPMWNQEELILPGHDGRQEPSIGVYGLDNQPTSLHFSRIKGDDLVTDKTVTTSDQLKKNIDGYGLMRSSILQADGNIQVCGTIYDDGDLHRVLEESGVYHTYKKPAEWKEKGKRNVLWPVQFSPDKLDDIKNDPAVSVYIYSCNYLLDPAPEDENAFAQLKWFPRYKERPKDLTFYAAADLAISEKETACETSIAVGGVDSNNELYIVDVRKGHWGSIEIIQNILDIQREYSPGLFTIEAENISRTIMPFLALKMREENVFPNIETLLPAGDKIAKARPFQGRAKEGAIWLPLKGVNQPEWLFDTEYQIRKFPRAKDKDILDSIALLCYQLARQWGPGKNDEGKNKPKVQDYNPITGDSNGWRIV